MLENIREYFEKKNIPKFRYKQLNQAVFHEFIIDFNEITVFPKTLKEQMSLNFSIVNLKQISHHKTEDSVKFKLQTEDKNIIETVLIFHKNRITICISCQIFCSLGCKFCATGANKFKRNLNVKEIISQVLIANNYLKNTYLQQKKRISNVVFMGMGEPFLNYENVMESIKILNGKDYLNIGARNIVVSSAGIVPKIYEFANQPLQIKLAISLHAPNDTIRSEIMPINKKYKIKSLIDATDYFSNKTNKKVSFEYVLLKDVNDSLKCAEELSSLLKHKLAHVNLIIYNPHKLADFEKPSREKVNKFKQVLQNNNIECSIRKAIGEQTNSACGQLSGKLMNEK